MNADDIVFSKNDAGRIDHAIIHDMIFFADAKVREMVREAILIEREACAKHLERIAAAIRARP